MISIITTVKNGERYLLETLESVRAQTYKNFEHIVVDDGSTDSTILVLNKFKSKYPDYPLFIFEPGCLGRGKALNYAVSKANGPWIAIIDADDLWHPKNLELKAIFLLNNPEVDVITSNKINFKNGRPPVFEIPKDLDFVNIKLNSILKSNKIPHNSTILRKSICQYDEMRQSQFDYELWMRLLSQNKKVVKLNAKLGAHRIHSNQSFEGKMGKSYRWRSFKLKMKYSVINKNIYAIIFNCLKFTFDMVFPRSFRLYIKKGITLGKKEQLL
jgi:teichuronic acid biosynthesis glycosyltransferase TuaG